MKKLILAVMMIAAPLTGMAAGGGVHLDHADIDLGDEAALQRGAKYFVNYCLGCHSAQYMRYQRLQKDLGLTEEEVEDNLMFTGEKLGNKMTIAAPPADQEGWFGKAPPDLTLTARNRKQGADWLYTYLRSFYLDDSKPTGVNNIVFPDVGMPHVLWDLQGLQKAVFREETDAQGNAHEVFEGFEQVTDGRLSPEEYDEAVRDLVTFMVYMSEPVKTERQSLGVYVLIFLVVFTVLAYFLKKEYWKDVH
ncbi:MAG: cytochrome c1 [Chromatiales bacterium]|jgi:ubiquinol-cytochrome c reductase cytochrome c1 subunit